MNSENKDDRNSTSDKPKPKHFPDQVDAKHTDGMHDDPSGRVGIAPAKPLWPSKK
ncbi:MAG: hypothetical protein PF904_07350 [Kiritimatiellae bacterium]|jgi:hypothetical protein|nr:hypothetical protein [Kiritimatiellia bacterium]